MSFRAVIFDLDGTLLDTIGDLADSMNRVLSRLGFPEHSLQSYKFFVGAGMVNLVRRALPADQSSREEFVTHCVALMREEYSKRWKEQTRPYEGIPELLDALTDRKITMAVLSNKPDDFTKACVREMLPRWRFEAVLGERSPVPRKPDPIGALEIARQLQVPSHDFLYAGDTGIDMQTANAAGMFAVGVLWGFRPADELRTSGAKALIQKPHELLELL